MAQNQDAEEQIEFIIYDQERTPLVEYLLLKILSPPPECCDGVDNRPMA
jgi:hypothetical protein